MVSHDDVACDLDLIVEAFGLHGIRRFFHQRFFEVETREAEYAARIEPAPRLETVSEHSWHLADAILLVAPRFPEVEIARAVQLAIVHDKLEMFIGDIDPIGRDGTGLKSHAFNVSAKARKRERELAALDFYLERLPRASREIQRDLHVEALECNTDAARLVKSIDKLVALSYILVKKAGDYVDRHLDLLHRLTVRNATIYVPSSAYHWELFDRIIESAEKFRGAAPGSLRALVLTQQLDFFDPSERG